MKLALLKAHEMNFDVFNCLDILDNSEFLHELKFGPGDGNLHYYLYNWNLGKRIEPGKVGVILV
jgi:glycylpeptide N-tetradecanoyltransferase